MVRVDASARITFAGQREQVRRAHALGADPDGAAHLRVPHWLPGAGVEREGVPWDAPNRLQVEIVAGSWWVVVTRRQARRLSCGCDLDAQGLVLQQWPNIGGLMSLVAGVCCVVVGLAIFMEVCSCDLRTQCRRPAVTRLRAWFRTRRA